MIIQNNQTAPYVPTLGFARLDEMTRVAMSQPQQRHKPSWSVWHLLNFNTAPAGLSFATVAMIVLLSATVVMTDLPQTDNASTNDIYAEVSDMLMLDTMDEMSTS